LQPRGKNAFSIQFGKDSSALEFELVRGKSVALRIAGSRLQRE
jgi:hypothetical protein